jgi:hypothetical protein
MESCREQIRAFVGRHLRGHDLRDGENFFASGSVSSMFAIQLVHLGVPA